MLIDGINEKIIFEIDDSSYAYSEVGKTISADTTNEKILTEPNGKKYKITLTLDYSDKLNITYKKSDTEKIFNTAQTPYKIVVENNGRDASNSNSLINIDVSDY